MWRCVQKIPRAVWSLKEGRELLRTTPEFRSIEVGAVLHQSVIIKLKNGRYKPKGFRGFYIEKIEEIFQVEDAPTENSQEEKPDKNKPQDEN